MVFGFRYRSCVVDMFTSRLIQQNVEFSVTSPVGVFLDRETSSPLY